MHGTDAADYYRAYATFASLIEQEAATNAMAVIPLEAGDVVTFNNRRMLHGRRAFFSKTNGARNEQLGRRLRGCYVNIDEFKNRHAVLSTARSTPIQGAECSRTTYHRMPVGNQDLE
jgi:gamma-butyrobetaine dioxygenase